MSRSNNTEIKNPAKVFFDWAGGKGCLRYFDKTLGEKGDNVDVKLPFTFLVLDRLSTISGFSDADSSGYWANEVRDTRTDKFTVRTKKGVVYEGLYANCDKIKAAGAQYAQSVYIAFFDAQNVMFIGNIKFSGSAIGAWIEFLKKHDVYSSAVVIADKAPKQKGATHYFEPVFALKEVTPESNAKAIELDKELQGYLKLYFKRNETEVGPADVVSEKQKDDIKNLNADGFGRGNHGTGDKFNDGDHLEPLDTFSSSDAADDLPF